MHRAAKRSAHSYAAGLHVGRKRLSFVSLGPVHRVGRRAFTLLHRRGAGRPPQYYSLHDFDDWVNLSQNGLGDTSIPPASGSACRRLFYCRCSTGSSTTVRFSRQSIFERDKSVCQYCGKHFPRTQLTIDHVLPQSRGGGDTWENLVLACLHCNVRKGNRTPDEANMPLLIRPYKPAWMPHFGARVPHDQLDVWKKFVDTSHWGKPVRESAVS